MVKLRTIHHCETQNGETQKSKTQIAETRIGETQNGETHNSETQNGETQNGIGVRDRDSGLVRELSTITSFDQIYRIRY